MRESNLKFRIKNSKLYFSLPVWHRIQFFFITSMLFTGIIFSEKGTHGLWIPAAICVISFLGGLYTEKWIFDKEKSSVSYLRGIPFIPFVWKRIEFNFGDIDRFLFETITRQHGKKNGMFITVLKTGERYEIDSSYKEPGREELLRRAHYTAQFCEIELKTPE